MKHVHVKVKAGSNNPYREDVRAALAILNCNSETWENITNSDSLVVSIGDLRVNTYVCPETWDAIQDFLMTLVCFAIQQGNLNDFPYYHSIFKKYSEILCRNDFVF